MTPVDWVETGGADTGCMQTTSAALTHKHMAAHAHLTHLFWIHQAPVAIGEATGAVLQDA